MDLGSFSVSLTSALKRAKELARSYAHAEITPAHFFLALLREEEGGIPAILKALGKKPEYFEALLADELSKLPKSSADEIKPTASPGLQSFLVAVSNKAQHYSESTVEPEHALMAFCAKDAPLSEAISRRLNFEEGQIIDAVADMKVVESIAGDQVMTEDGEAAATAAGGIKYCVDMTERAKKGDFDKFFGREEDIYTICRVLIRRRKNNPILVGPPGVGKSALVEGLAAKIVNKEVPEELQDTVILGLDLGQLVAGAKYKGEFEERFQALISRLAKGKGNLVLFIDEVHTLVGAGNPSGGMDAANLIKPALARGTLKVIGATTLDEYRKYIEKDKALDRRFQRVAVDEPTFEESEEILSGVRDVYQEHHQLTIPDEVVTESIRLSKRYIGDRFLPDKAIDLLDEAAAAFRLNRLRAADSIVAMREKAEQIKSNLGLKFESADDTNLDEDLMLSLREFDQSFQEFFEVWQGRVS
ncbi:MAG: ATP-dependent Clp protease ATP-binding subunit [bacterium]